MNYEIQMEKAERFIDKLVITPTRDAQISVDKFLSECGDSYPKWVLTLSKRRKKRSLDANAYMWQLCDKIAWKISAPGVAVTKEEVYQKAIMSVGVFENILIQDAAVDAFIKHWNSGGLGNFAEAAYKSKKNPGSTVITVYHGSSSYDSEEMSRLINYIVEQAEEQGIDTRTPDEIAHMISLWGGRNE